MNGVSSIRYKTNMIKSKHRKESYLAWHHKKKGYRGIIQIKIAKMPIWHGMVKTTARER